MAEVREADGQMMVRAGLGLGECARRTCARRLAREGYGEEEHECTQREREGA